MSRISFGLVIAATLLAASSAHTQESGNFYVGGGLGLVLSGNTRSDGIFTGTGTSFDGQRLGPSPGNTAKGNFDPSLTTSVTVGYDLGERRYGRFRFEGELFYQTADSDKYDGQLGGVELNPAGRVDTSMTGLALNALYDIGSFSAVTPYFFLGYGRASVETTYDFPDRGSVRVDGNSRVIQGGFGMDIPYKDRMTFDLKYRFRRAGLNENGLDTDLDAHVLEFGMRYAFD